MRPVRALAAAGVLSLALGLTAACQSAHANARARHQPTNDVRITSCALNTALRAGAVAGVITNDIGKTADYVVHIDFTDPAGAHLDEAMHAETNVIPGGKIPFTASGVATYDDKVVCRISSVERIIH